jgi:trimeric autotransporter adhesin
MIDYEYEQAEQLEKYWASLTKAGTDEAPEELAPELAAMSQQLARLFHAPDPEPAFVEKLLQQLSVQAASSASANRARLFPLFSSRSFTRKLAVGAALVLALVGFCLWMIKPQPVKAQEIIQKAREAATLHASGKVRSFVMTEVRHGTLNDPRLQAELGLKDDAQILSETRRWYVAPNRWRMEFTQKIVGADGKQVKSYATIGVGDGTNNWVFNSEQNTVTVNPIAAGQKGKPEINFFGEDVNGLNHLFVQAGKCFDPKVTGNDTVAGRATFVIDFGPTKCPSVTVPVMNGRETIWVDRETFFVLKHELRAKDSSKSLASSEVTKIEHNIAIDPKCFVFTSPAGARINDIRPAPSSKLFSSPANGAQASAQAIDSPYAVAADGAGGFYFSSQKQNRIYKVAADGSISLTAGAGSNGFSGDGGPATAAQFDHPSGVAVDSAGNLFIADPGNNRIRKVTTAGIVSTVAGGGTGESANSDGGLATAAMLRNPSGVAVDSAGNLFIADYRNHRVRKVTTAGIISTAAGDGTEGHSGDGGMATAAQLGLPTSVTVDSAGNLYITELNSHRIRKITAAGIINTVAGGGTGNLGDGGPATAAYLSDPTGVAIDSAGNLYIAESNTNRIRKVTAAGIISTAAGKVIAGFSGDGGAAAAAQLDRPSGVAVDPAGNLYIVDSGNNRIRKVTTAGIISTVAGSGISGFSGDGGQAAAAPLRNPSGVAVDSGGNLYIADEGNNRICKVTTAGIISTAAGNGISGFSGDGGPATAALLRNPSGVAVDSAGNLFIADTGNNQIRKVTPAGIISTVAGRRVIGGFSGDGGTATNAQLKSPKGVAVDSAGNLYIADGMRICKVTTAGIISTLAGPGTFGLIGLSGDGGRATETPIFPADVAIDSAGNIYITEKTRIRKVTPEGIISTVAGIGTAGFSGDGGLATAAQLKAPKGVAVDSAGNLYFADSQNNRIRKVTTEGIISTVAGNGTAGLSGDGDLATAAQLNHPQGVAVDSAGNLFIADAGNNRIRKATPEGIISTVAGKGK